MPDIWQSEYCSTCTQKALVVAFVCVCVCPRACARVWKCFHSFLTTVAEYKCIHLKKKNWSFFQHNLLSMFKYSVYDLMLAVVVQMWAWVHLCCMMGGFHDYLSLHITLEKESKLARDMSVWLKHVCPVQNVFLSTGSADQWTYKMKMISIRT